MQIPILSGIYSDTTPNLRTSYPINMIPIPKDNGIAKGYLKPADGINLFSAVGSTCPGIDRGGIVWNGLLYRVLGSKLCLVTNDGNITILADVGTDNKPVALDISFDRIAIASNTILYYWDGLVLTQVTDTNLPFVNDMLWMDGYYVVTDGNYIVVTNLANPTIVNPLAYGAPENEPSPIMGLEKLREELYCVKRYSISVYDNVGNSTGTSFFPFEVNNGALLLRGAIGTNAKCVFNNEVIAFVGSGINEPVSIWFGVNGQTIKIATREIDTILQNYSDFDLSQIVVDSRIDKGNKLLYIHLPDQTLVYDAGTSEVIGQSIWFIVHSALTGTSRYQANHFVWAYDNWVVGDPTQARLGTFTDNISHHYANSISWEFGTTILYNSTNGIIIHELELVVFAGKFSNDSKSTVYTSHSTDLETWSREYPRSAGKIGSRNIRLNWLQQGNMQVYRVQKFRGTSDA